MAKTKLPALSPEDLADVAQWLAEQGEAVPTSVRTALGHFDAVVSALSGSRRRLSQVTRELRRALGIESKSERRTSGDALGPLSGGDGQRPKSRREKLQVSLARLERLSGWHRGLATRHRRAMKQVKEQLQQLGPEQEALTAQEQAQLETENRAQMARFVLGSQADPALESVSETLMSGGQITTSETRVQLAARVPEGEEVTVVQTLTEERERYDFTLTVTKVVATVEKKVVVDAQGERRVVSAKTTSLGPPRYAVTWAFLTNLAVLVGQYAMPLHRLGSLLSTADKQFTAASLSRLLRYVAERFAPVYLELFDGLCDSGLLMGDDTPPRVLEVKRYFAKMAEDPELPPPWHRYRTRAEALQSRGLEAMLARELGFEFARRAGDGPKQSLQTTVLSGRSEAEDPLRGA